jgi:exonuclease III
MSTAFARYKAKALPKRSRGSMPTAFCSRKNKAQADQINKELDGIDGYRIYSNCAERKGYFGVTLLSRKAPLEIINNIGIAEHDREGRVIAAEFEHFFCSTSMCRIRVLSSTKK